MIRNFNPPIPCGMGHLAFMAIFKRVVISIHPSRVGWDAAWRIRPTATTDFNPPIPCGMGHAKLSEILQNRLISIHPSRVGWDVDWDNRQREIDPFQSTHPVWDGTRFLEAVRAEMEHFNPPIPCGMGLAGGATNQPKI